MHSKLYWSLKNDKHLSEASRFDFLHKFSEIHVLTVLGVCATLIGVCVGIADGEFT